MRLTTRGRRALFLLSLVMLLPITGFALVGKSYVRFESSGSAFALSINGQPAPLCASQQDFPGVVRVLRIIQRDVKFVTGGEPALELDHLPLAKSIVLVGTLGKNPLIDQLVKEKKLDVKGVKGEWEASLVQVVDNPFPGIDHALVIVGSDKRGTIYALFGLSEQIGVSPWYWWGDVPIKQHASIYVAPGRHATGPPSVKYRGIFLNDEFPALTKWVGAKYGKLPPRGGVPDEIANYNHEFYLRIFEVLLRLKGNYLWPAMWNNAFNEDDPENPRLADELGIVMGTSHQEPMLRAQKEWDRRYKKTLGSWNYAAHPETLENFWREGIRRNKDYESIVTIGLRGADDTPMAPGGPAANMALLEKIIDVQRKILAAEVQRDVTKIPQLWCLYKEVLEFYNAGMRAPDDVTLLWPDDNWGNVRRLPTAQERKRAGGAGIYYHFDYHGGPRSYQWINANPLPKVWEQMTMAKDFGADRIWIVNVGHFKGYELPMEFFLDLGWDTEKWRSGNVKEYTREWAKREFGPSHATEIVSILSKYTKYNARRKPELLSPTTYNLVNYREAERVLADFDDITKIAGRIFAELPAEQKDAFYGLVLFPTKASALVNRLYVTAGKNALYAQQGRAGANDMAEETRTLFAADTALMGYYNRTYVGGKWDHFMDQAHLGYLNWADPPENSLRAIPLKEITVPEAPGLGVALEGSTLAWPGAPGTPALPEFDPYTNQRRSLEIFNKGRTPFSFVATVDRPWIRLSVSKGPVGRQAEITITIDWQQRPKQEWGGEITITGAGETVNVMVTVSRNVLVPRTSISGFLESDGVVAMEAEHCTAHRDAGQFRWIKIADYGRTLSGMKAVAPTDDQTYPRIEDAPCLEYRMYLLDTGTVHVSGVFAPTLNFIPGRGLRYAVSFDNETPRSETLVPADFIAQHDNMDWERSVADNARISTTTHTIKKAGYHTLKIRMVDAGVVLEKIVVDCGGLRPSYGGPPESYHRKTK